MARFLVVLAVCFVAGASAQNPAWMENIHNQENENRAMHGVAPLTMSDELAQHAQEWADTLAAECGKMHHADQDTEGENIFFGGVTPIQPDMVAYAQSKADAAANNWYSEIKDYPWPEYTGQDIGGKMVFHFSQQVWKDTQQVGYGLGARDGCNKFFVVARYFPGGNVVPMFGSNVLPKQG